MVLDADQVTVPRRLSVNGFTAVQTATHYRWMHASEM